MAARREGLRTPKVKEPKKKPTTNAERCKTYRELLKKDPEKHDIFKAKKKQENQKYRQQMTEDQKAAARERSRLAMQKKRAEQKKVAKETPPPSAKKTQDRCKTREQAKKDTTRKEKTRLRQQKRRALMSSQKKRRVNEARRQKYHSKKTLFRDAEPVVPKRSGLSIHSLLKGVQRACKRARSKLGLFKLEFVGKLLKRQDVDSVKHPHTYYKRREHSNANFVEAFLEKSAIDYPGKKGASTPKKVLTKTMEVLLKEFKEQNPNTKMSLTTFKRRRPRHIVLSHSRKFLQCLCEKCTNMMLLIDVINPYLLTECSGNTGNNNIVKSCEDLINRTLCPKSTRESWERLCDVCGVGCFIEAVRTQTHGNRDDLKTWSKWGKN